MQRTGTTLAGALATALLFLAMLFFHHASWAEFFRSHENLSTRLAQVREDISIAHLRLEEAVHSGSAGKMEEAKLRFESAIKAIDESLPGKREAGEKDEVKLTGKLADLRWSVVRLKQLSEKRWKEISDTGPVSYSDREFENSFQETLAMAGEAGETLGQIFAGRTASQDRQFAVITALWLLIVVAGSVALYLISRSRDRAQESVAKSAKSLEEAQKIAKMGNWDWDMATGGLKWSDEIYRIFGVDKESFGATYEAFMGFVHPEDRSLVTSAVENALKKNTKYSIEHRIVRPDGALRIVHEWAEVFYDHTGKAVRMIGAVQDITERKAAEDQLALARKIFENAIEGVIVTDPAGVIQFVNPAVTAITGYAADELIGLTPRVLRSQRQDKEFYKGLWRSLLTQGGWSGEIWNRRKSGEAYPEWLNIRAIKDANGKTIRYVSIFHDITQIKKSEETIQRHISHDALTDLPNRALFEDRLDLAISSAHREGKKLAVLFVGLDRFRNINETLGHVAGDELLQRVSARFSPWAREGDTIARFSGDEFALLMEDPHTEQDAAHLAFRAIKAVEDPFTIMGHEIFITASAGVALYPADGTEAAMLIRNAQSALKRAKDEGKNTFQLYTPAMNVRTREMLSLENDLRRALEREEFVIYYQPKVSLVTGAVTGMEALIRWAHPTRGMVSPADFIPLAEETGLIAPIGEWVLIEALKKTKIWHDMGYGHLAVAVNISAIQFRKKDLLRTMEKAIAASGVAPASLNVELTESVVMKNVESAVAILGEIKEMGVDISIDDFGTGYSSLNYLKKFPIDYLKVDKSFIFDITTDPDAAAISNLIIAMAHILDIKVVAEGVETEDQLKFLKENACDERKCPKLS